MTINRSTGYMTHLRDCPSQIRRRSFLQTYAIVLFAVIGLSCQTAYYETMEQFGYHKRDLLVRDVEKARDAQQEAKEQFKSALDRFTKTLDIQGGELQEKYEALNKEYTSGAKTKRIRFENESRPWK